MLLYERDYLLICVAFIVGLAFSALPWGGFVLLGVGGLVTLCQWQRIGPFSRWDYAPRYQTCLVVTGVALFAFCYFYVRLPQPAANDISRIIPRLEAIALHPTVKVRGAIETLPQQNRSGKVRFYMAARAYEFIPTQLQSEQVKGFVAGKVLVTIPADEGKRLYPGQHVAVTGFLSRPRVQSGGAFYQVFNFRKQLQAEGAFASLSGYKLTPLNRGAPWGWWRIRQIIYRTHLSALGKGRGPVLSAMVLGNRAVGIPFHISDAFRQAGLAHALAASGFQTSLILAAVLALANNLPQRQKFLAGGLALLLFGGLSGFAPSVLRAVLMGFVSLAALVGKTRVKPIPTLLAIAVLMLLINPLWIEDIGFQLSFLATLGLIVSAPAITRRLDWLPPRIATLIAVPLAATLWVLPLQLAVFGIFPLYGFLANVLTTLLLEVVTVGGFVSALAALVWPLLGKTLAWLMYLPISLLLGLVQFFSQLPGSALALGSLSSAQVVVLYGLLGAIWLVPHWRQYWKWALGAGLGFIFIPFLFLQITMLRVTVLDSPRVPMMLIQQPGANILINSGSQADAAQGVGSFLAFQGVNRIDWAIATERKSRSQQGWPELQKQRPIRIFSEVPTARSDPEYRQMVAEFKEIKQQPLQLEQPITLGATNVKLLKVDPAVIQLTIKGVKWLLITHSANEFGQEIWLESVAIDPIDVLWWSGEDFSAEIAEKLKPKVIIITASFVEQKLLAQLTAAKIRVFWTEQDGAIRWIPPNQFIPNLVQSTGDGS
jgi:competence protein ComEC